MGGVLLPLPGQDGVVGRSPGVSALTPATPQQRPLTQSKVDEGLEGELGYLPTTHSSVTFLGIPLGKALRCLLLQRTTVSRQVHSCGHWGRGMQLVSSLPAPGMESHQVSRVQPLGIV